MGSPTDIDVEKLKIEYEKLKDENVKLLKQVEELKKEVNLLYNKLRKKRIKKCIIKKRISIKCF